MANKKPSASHIWEMVLITYMAERTPGGLDMARITELARQYVAENLDRLMAMTETGADWEDLMAQEDARVWEWLGGKLPALTRHPLPEYGPTKA